MENKLKELFDNEQKSRDAKNYKECLGICIRILKFISDEEEDSIFDKISKLFLYKNQSNFVRIGIIFFLLFRNYININSNKNLKRKFYQLLIDSFKNDTIKDKQNEKNNIINFFEKSDLKNFKELDDYILTLDNIFISEKSNSSDRDLFSNNEKDKNLKFDGKKMIENIEETLNPDESNQNQITHYGLVEEINTKQFEINSTIQNIMSESQIENNEKYLLKKYKPNYKLPMIVISVSVNLNSISFMDLVDSTFAKLKYRNICNIKSSLNENINIYEYNPKNFIEKTVYCLSNRRAFIKNMFQVVVLLKKDDNNFSSGLNYFLNDTYERKIQIKTIKGREKNVINFIIKYLKLFSSSINKIKIIKQSKIFYKYNLEQTLNEQIKTRKNLLLKSINIPKKKLQNPPEEETLVEKSNKKANQFYEIYKILSNKEYELGKSINEYIEKFRTKYNEISSLDKDENINNINTKSIMIGIIKMIESSTNTLNCNFNSINSIYDSTFFSTATEQFIFNKIYHLLYNIYDKKYKKVNDEYLLIKKDINENLSPKDIISKVGVKNEYKGNESLPYKNVIEIVNKIPYEKSLKNKFQILTQCSLEMRNCILEYTSGKDELVSMDDELPIIVYIITQIKIDNLFAELYMVDDYIKCSMRDDLIQNKMVTNLLSSLVYVGKTWDSKLKSFNS